MSVDTFDVHRMTTQLISLKSLPFLPLQTYLFQMLRGHTRFGT